jgi:hypothetical protein
MVDDNTDAQNVFFDNFESDLTKSDCGYTEVTREYNLTYDQQ